MARDVDLTPLFMPNNFIAGSSKWLVRPLTTARRAQVLEFPSCSVNQDLCLHGSGLKALPEATMYLCLKHVQEFQKSS